MTNMKISCEICGELTHAVQMHLKEKHPEMSIQKYREIYPNAETLSELAKMQLEKKRKEKEETETHLLTNPEISKVSLRKAFGLRKNKGVMSSSGEEIMIDVLPSSGNFADMIPDIDTNYIFNTETLKNVLMGIEENIPVLLWGDAGVGKSTLFEQVCARTNRRYMRVQHTANTEESHIVGQILANDSGTYFEPGPLTLAMKNGWVYNADEYDFAHASITAVYQPVLEGKPLIIKEAPDEWRVIKPHRNFRFVATGNTNGSGDETGLYAGTNIGNSANYSRFGITDRVDYLESNLEAKVISGQAKIEIQDANLLIDFAQKIREAYRTGKMSATVGTRELIYAAKVGLRKDSWKKGVELAFINRMSTIDREVASGIAQRVFEEA